MELCQCGGRRGSDERQYVIIVALNILRTCGLDGECGGEVYKCGMAANLTIDLTHNKTESQERYFEQKTHNNLPHFSGNRTSEQKSGSVDGVTQIEYPFGMIN